MVDEDLRGGVTTGKGETKLCQVMDLKSPWGPESSNRWQGGAPPSSGPIEVEKKNSSSLGGLLESSEECRVSE